MAEAIEPVPKLPVPRRVKLRADAKIAGPLPRVAAFVLAGIGVLFFVYFCFQFLLVSNTPVEGRITAIRIPQDPKAKGAPKVSDLPNTGLYKTPTPKASVDYTFRVDNRFILGSSAIKKEQIKLLPQSDMIKVRYVPAFAERWNRPILPNDSLPAYVTKLGLLTALVGGLAYFLYRRFIAPQLMQRNLCRTGIPGTGTITSKDGIGSNNFTIRYQFTPEDSESNRGNKVSGEMEVPGSYWSSVEAGESVTVLYSKENPQINMAYEPAIYMIDHIHAGPQTTDT
jgi:hypothetical protein